MLKNTFFLPGILTKTNKFFLLCISDSSCCEVDAPAIGTHWKKQEAGWEVILTWPRSYDQVNTQKVRLLRQIWNEGNILTVLLLLLMMNLLIKKLRSMSTHIPFSSIFPTFPLSISKMACSPPRWSLSERTLKKSWLVFWDQLWHHQLEVSTTQPVLQSEGAKKWIKWKNWQLAWRSSENKSVPSIHCEQLNPFH